MLRSELKAVLSVLGVVVVPFAVQADQPMSQSQSQNQQKPEVLVPGEIAKEGQLPAGYNASATFQCENGWDIFVTGDYIYWTWGQDSLEVGELQTAAHLSPDARREFVYLDPGYASGFQVGLGFNMPGMDDWNLYSEYTWYKNSTSKSWTTPSGFVIDPELDVFARELYLDGTIAAEAKMNFSALDFLLKRPFYFGKKLTANFSAGLSALWISQRFTTSLVGEAGFSSIDLTLDSDVTHIAKQTSWGLGPKFGIETNWMLGYGLQIMANLSASFLYTQYEVNGSTSGSVTGTGPTSYLSSKDLILDGFGTVRPITEAFLGLGWGTGFCDDEFRLALSAGYDFNVYWDYNMRAYGKNSSTGNMYLQGLNVSARFDF